MGLVQREEQGAGACVQTSHNPRLRLLAEAATQTVALPCAGLESYQRRQPAVTSHHAWPTLVSRLPKKGGLSQWQGRGVAQLGRREGLGSIRPQETTQRPEGQPQGAAHPVANTLPFPGDLTPGYETTDRACLAPPTLPCLHCQGFTFKSFCH